jgi:fructosamine-3-kinase
MDSWARIAQHISASRGKAFHPQAPRSIGGGCINTAVKLSDGRDSYFVKLNQAKQLMMFEAEAEGLAEIRASQSLRAPQALCCAIAGQQAYLVLEHIEMGHAASASAEQAGRLLADMHRTTQTRFGWHRENTIGSTPQLNTQTHEWIDFWRTQRLGFQLKLAEQNGYAGELRQQGEQLMERLPALLEHQPQPSLLHGDLWGGNMGFDESGQAVIYDPAVYYGDREADLAMTELFGGFSSHFYAAYQEAWPLDAGYSTRKTLYNLYHILNHLNLFGSGYLGQARSMIGRLLALS